MSNRFYADLEAITNFDQAFDQNVYETAPDSWSVVITDVVGSTQAIQEGRYKDVNALGVASIVAVRNAVPDIDFPFVFGGDGASMVCPSSSLPQIVPALRGVKATAVTSFSLEMRAAVVPVADLTQAGARIQVARLRVSPHACFALFAGGGLQLAETWVKDDTTSPRYEVSGPGPRSANFDGFECRWNPLPSRKGVMVSLLVQSMEHPPDVNYRRVTSKLAEITNGESACPVDVANLELGRAATTFNSEAKLRSGKQRGLRFWLAQKRAQATTSVGRLLLARNWNLFGFPADYRDEVVQNSDYRKFDDMLRMVLDLAPQQLTELEVFLASERSAGRLLYGLHRANSATLTCVVGNYAGNHVHFVDGADGGYAAAAKELKAQIAARPQRNRNVEAAKSER